MTTKKVWILQLLLEFRISMLEVTKVYCDNTLAIFLAHNPIHHAKTKHIEINYPFIKG